MSIAQFSLPQHRRRFPALPVLFLMLLAVILLGAGIGASFMSPDRVFAAILGQGSDTDQIILWTLRLPRVALAVLGGASLALAGAILQVVTRNPLAAPSILGITDGAAVGVVAFLWLFSNESNALIVSVHWQPLAAVVGAIVFLFVAGVLTLSDPLRGPLRLILYGIAIAALAKAAVTMLIILGPVYRASQAMTWLTGTVGAAHWSDAAMIGGMLLVAAPVLGLSVPVLAQLQLDEDSARSTGLPLGRAQIGLVVLAVILTAGSVAHIGAVGFIGLIAPHAARLLRPSGGAAHLIATAMIGAILLLAADILARIIAPPLELPAGAVTAVIGAPLFLFLLLRRSTPHG